MIRIGLDIQPQVFNIALASCTKADEMALALKLCDQIKVLTKNKFAPNHSTFSLAIYAAWKLKNGPKAHEVWCSLFFVTFFLYLSYSFLLFRFSISLFVNSFFFLLSMCTFLINPYTIST